MKINKTYNNVIFSADKKTIDPTTGEYKDPLMHWPLRGAAFTNEVGEALRPLIGKWATVSWAPALLYIGADVYDKYKNDQTEFSPDSERCLKQACFQGLASVLLPIVAVKAGQNLFSLFGLMTKDKLSLNAQERVIKLAQQFVANGKIRAYKNNDPECIKEFIDIVEHNIEYRHQECMVKNPLKRMFKNYKPDTKESLDKFAKKTISKLIRTRKQLLNPSENIKQHNIYKRFEQALSAGETNNVAVKSVMNKFLDSKTLKGRFVKTLGGFIFLGIAISPIDKFVENVLIGKVIGPGLEKRKGTAD